MHSIILVALVAFEDGGRHVRVLKVALNIAHYLMLVVEVAAHRDVKLLADILLETHHFYMVCIII